MNGGAIVVLFYIASQVCFLRADLAKQRKAKGDQILHITGGVLFGAAGVGLAVSLIISQLS